MECENLAREMAGIRVKITQAARVRQETRGLSPAVPSGRLRRHAQRAIAGRRRRIPGRSGEFIEPLTRAAAAVGIDGLFVEVHEEPQKALSDGANALRLDLLEGFLNKVQRIA